MTCGMSTGKLLAPSRQIDREVTHARIQSQCIVARANKTAFAVAGKFKSTLE